MSTLNQTTIAFIGGGVMGEALLAGVLNHGLIEPQRIIVSEPVARRRDELTSKYHIAVTANSQEAVSSHEMIVLSVKPQDLPTVLDGIRGGTRPSQLVLSIVAGANIDSLRRALGTPAIVRVMPNTPAQIGEGMSVWTATAETSAPQREQARTILAALGHEVVVAEEKYLDMATAISGSGPAYVFLVLEALIDAGVHLGFSRPVAQELVTQTMLGSVLYARQTGRHPAELRNQVTSPGGTTAEALYELEKGRIRTVFSQAVRAAYQRSQELGQLNQVNIERRRDD